MIQMQFAGLRWTTFANGDKLLEFADGATEYRYAGSGTVEIRAADGRSAIEFPNRQRQFRARNGDICVELPDGRRCMCDRDGIPKTKKRKD
jgi:hypothetical protein